MIKKKKSLMKQKVTLIIVAALLIAALGITLAVVLNIANTHPVIDEADGATYYLIKRDGVYAMYASDKKTLLPVDGQYGYYEAASGTLFDVDKSTGEYEAIRLAATMEGTNEELGFGQRFLIFPHIEKKNIAKLEVSNSNGAFTFLRVNAETLKPDNSGDFIIEGSPLVAYDQEMFASLYVSAGYTLTSHKIADPIKDANGEFSEYGLVAEKRTREKIDPKTGKFELDDEGNYVYEEYDYVPAFYVLTDTSGNKYKVIIGDMLVTGGGYYVQYVDVSGETEVKRDAVYVLTADFGDTMLASIEEFVTPQLTYPMSMNSYFDVERFLILSRNKNAGEGDNFWNDPTIGFSYIDLSERENTINASEPYVFLSGFGLAGYKASSDNIDSCLQSLYSPGIVKVAKLAPSIEDMVKYGLAIETGVNEEGKTTYDMAPEFVVTFNYDALDENGKVMETVNNMIYISEVNEDGNRYAFTEIYSVKSSGASDELLYSMDMILEVEGYSLEFLSWDRYDWINESYVNLNIAFCDKITLSTPNYSATFELDNTASDSTESISSTNLKVHATDSTGKDMETFSMLTCYDKNGNQWIITATEIKCYSPAGTELKITTAYYDYNRMGTQVRVVSGYIECMDGTQVYVSADEVRVVGVETKVYVRYNTNLFRQFYKTLLYASISDSYVVSEEKEQEIVTEANRLLTMTITNSQGETYIYNFYKIPNSNRKAYITVSVDKGDGNGPSEANGGFYVLVARVDKFTADAQRFFANELIDSTAKN